MISIRKINPMVRAVGTMGAVAAVAGGITFAALTSNTVALSSNTLTSASAHLLIGAAGEGGTCTADNSTSVTGMDLKLTPGEKSEDFKFCLKNDGDVKLDLTGTIPAADLLDSPIPAGMVTLDVTCGGGGSASGALSSFSAKSLGSLDADASTDCTANATLAGDYSGDGTSVKPFTLNFVGTQSESAPSEPSTPPEETPTEE